MGAFVATAKGRYAHACRYDLSQVIYRRRDLEFAKSFEALEKAVAASPLPFTATQRRQFVRLLRSPDDA